MEYFDKPLIKSELDDIWQDLMSKFNEAKIDFVEISKKRKEELFKCLNYNFFYDNDDMFDYGNYNNVIKSQVFMNLSKWKFLQNIFIYDNVEELLQNNSPKPEDTLFVEYSGFIANKVKFINDIDSKIRDTYFDILSFYKDSLFLMIYETIITENSFVNFNKKSVNEYIIQYPTSDEYRNSYYYYYKLVESNSVENLRNNKIKSIMLCKELSRNDTLESIILLSILEYNINGLDFEFSDQNIHALFPNISVAEITKAFNELLKRSDLFFYFKNGIKYAIFVSIEIIDNILEFENEGFKRIEFDTYHLNFYHLKLLLVYYMVLSDCELYSVSLLTPQQITQWFKISERSAQDYLKQWENSDIISKKNKRIYINKKI